MSNKLVYISGIGADARAFSNIQIHSDLEHVHADCIALQSTSEPFESYCDRMIQVYDISSEDILVGLSFGGFIAQQMAKVLGNKKVILISSFRNKYDLQPLMIFGLKFKLNKMLPSFRIPLLSDIVAIFLNSWNNDSRAILKEMLKTADFGFINWSIMQIGLINLSDSFSSGFLCFTGANDKVVSDWGRENHVSIEKGSHFMLYDLGEEISKEINRRYTFE